MTDNADTVREYLFGIQNEHRRNELFRALDALVAERDRLRTEKANLVENNAMLHRSAVGNRDLRKAAEADRDAAAVELIEERLAHTDALTRVRDLEQALREIAKHGTRHDCNPTVMIVNDDAWLKHHAWWCQRAQSMDDSVRARARAALGSGAAEGNNDE